MLGHMLHTVIHGQCIVGADKGVTSCLLGSTFRDLGHARRASEKASHATLWSSYTRDADLQADRAHGTLNWRMASKASNAHIGLEAPIWLVLDAVWLVLLSRPQPWTPSGAVNICFHVGRGSFPGDEACTQLFRS